MTSPYSAVFCLETPDPAIHVDAAQEQLQQSAQTPLQISSSLTALIHVFMFSETMLGGFNGSKSINMTLDYSHNVSGFNVVAVASYIILVISLKIKTRSTAHLKQW